MDKELHLVWVGHKAGAVSGMLIDATDKEEAERIAQDAYPLSEKKIKSAGTYIKVKDSPIYFTWTAPNDWINFDG